MSPDQIALVQESFKKVVPIAADAADLFYERLFTIAPEFRPLFPHDLREQKKKLIAMLVTVVGNLHQLERMLPAVQDLGRRHAAYGIIPEYYPPVGEALLWALGQGLGADFTPQSGQLGRRLISRCPTA
jgi:hemoglobin-like flavoprotein